VDILGKEAKKSKDRKKSEESGREEIVLATQKAETEISVNKLYDEIRRLNKNLENMENSSTQNSPTTLSNLLGNLDLTTIIGILTVINSLMNNNQSQQTQSQQTQSLPNMIQQMLPLLDMTSTNTDSTK
jgi:hypothetical protein